MATFSVLRRQNLSTGEKLCKLDILGPFLGFSTIEHCLECIEGGETAPMLAAYVVA